MLTGCSQGAVDTGSRNLADGQKIAIQGRRPLNTRHQWAAWVAKKKQPKVRKFIMFIVVSANPSNLGGSWAEGCPPQ